MAFTEGANDLPVVGGVKFSGMGDGVLTTAGLWVPRSYAAGDTLDGKFVPAAGVYGWNAATADRVRTAPAAGGATGTVGVLAVGAHLFDPGGATYRVARSANGTGDGIAGSSSQTVAPWLFNGATWDRARSGSAANLAATTQTGTAVVTQPGDWTSIGNPATTVAATTTKAAGAAGVRHVCTGAVALITTGATAQGPLLLTLRDGASGAGTVLMVAYLAAPANSAGVLALTGLHIVGSAATAMTLEFSNASAVGSFQTVTLTGYSVA